MVDYVLLKQYSFAMYFATSMMTIIWNIYLLVKIRYGDILITKSTLKPYYLSLWFLVLNFIKAIVRFYI